MRASERYLLAVTYSFKLLGKSDSGHITPIFGNRILCGDGSLRFGHPNLLDNQTWALVIRRSGFAARTLKEIFWLQAVLTLLILCDFLLRSLHETVSIIT